MAKKSIAREDLKTDKSISKKVCSRYFVQSDYVEGYYIIQLLWCHADSLRRLCFLPGAYLNRSLARQQQLGTHHCVLNLINEKPKEESHCMTFQAHKTTQAVSESAMSELLFHC